MNRYFEEYLEYIRSVRALSPRTVEGYRRDLALFDSFLDGMSPFEAVESDLRLFAAELGQKSREPAGVNRVLSALRGFYRYAVRFGLTESNPAATVRNLKVHQRMPAFLFAEEAAALCKKPDSAGILWPARDTALLTMLYSTGCRVSEIVNLSLADMDPEGTSATVTGKGRKQRKVFFSREARSALADYLAERNAVLARHQERDLSKNRLFISKRDARFRCAASSSLSNDTRTMPVIFLLMRSGTALRQPWLAGASTYGPYRKCSDIQAFRQRSGIRM